MASDLRACFPTQRPLLLRELAFPAPLRLLVLAPHPDDFDAVAVTLRHFHQRGHALSLVVLSSGWSGVEDAFCDPPTPARKAAVREEEQRASCRLFGLPDAAVSFARLVEDAAGHIADMPANRAAVAALFAAARPDFVFCPHGNDTHPDHRWTAARVAELGAAAGRPVVAWLNHDPKTIAMPYDVVTEFDEAAAAWKGALLRCHASQHQRNLRTRGHGFDERILADNRALARALGLAAGGAEAFALG